MKFSTTGWEIENMKGCRRFSGIFVITISSIRQGWYKSYSAVERIPTIIHEYFNWLVMKNISRLFYKFRKTFANSIIFFKLKINDILKANYLWLAISASRLLYCFFFYFLININMLKKINIKHGICSDRK